MNASEANVSNEVMVDNEDEKYDGYHREILIESDYQETFTEYQQALID